MFVTRLSVAVALFVSVCATASAQSVPPVPVGGGAAAPEVRQGSGYPVLGAPLYPTPVQYTPAWSGGTIITNQALAPHEMLYPHQYHAMYGPFYYRVQGCYVVTPLGVRQHENWKLEGTQVKVKYHPHFKLFSGYHPPVSH